MKNNEQIDKFGDEIKKQFEQLGDEIKDQMLKDFNKVLNDDMNSLRDTLGKIIEAQNKNLLKQSQDNLQKTILQEFGGNVFADVFGDAILPAVLGGGFRSSDFRASAGQSLMEIGRAMARSQVRNG